MNSLREPRTFRPKKTTPVGTKGVTLRRHIEATLGSGNILDAVRLPEGEDFYEWLAVNTVDFYNAISVLFGMLEDVCTAQNCSLMTAGPKYEYLWADPRYRKPVRLPAPDYVSALFDWLELQLDDPEIFPHQYGVPFPANFMAVVKVIFKRLFRVYAHIYHSHFKHVCSLDAEAHLNSCFKHFIAFAQMFDLIENKELAPLQQLIDEMIR